MTATRHGNLIGGAWSAAGEDGELAVRASHTGEVIAHVPNAGAEVVDRAVATAERAFEGWQDFTPRERSTLLLRLADAIDADAETLAGIESGNTGRSLAAARDEVAHGSDAFRFFAGAARNLEGKAVGEYLRGRTSMIRRDPIGVCAQITPWNYPFMMAALAIAPALAGGNTTVLKPSELTPLTTLRLAELAAGVLPDGVLNVLTGEGAVTGEALVAHPRVRMVSMIGDVATGKRITRTSAETLKRLHLELGGKAPVIVFDDADLDRLAATLRGASYWNAGQDCTAATRILVSGRVYDDFLSELVPQVASLAVGPPEVADVEMGPVISERHRERVLGFVERAQASGATVLQGGGACGERGWFVEPTIVADVDQDAEIVQKEVFGPVVTVQRFHDDEEAIAWANGVEYGLAASVWSESPRRLFSAARRLQFGTVWLNDHFPMANEMPHGGFKQSGYGKDQSMYSLEDFTVVKHVMLNIASPDADL